MAHTPYGYDIKGGKAVINEEHAATVRTIYKLYLEGNSLNSIAKKSGYEKVHTSIGNILKNKRYLGDDYYPRIIDDELFQKVSDERHKRALAHGHIGKREKSLKKARKNYSFKLKKKDTAYSDPYLQAEYIYRNIEVEVTDE